MAETVSVRHRRSLSTLVDAAIFFGSDPSADMDELSRRLMNSSRAVDDYFDTLKAHAPESYEKTKRETDDLAFLMNAALDRTFPFVGSYAEKSTVQTGNIMVVTTPLMLFSSDDRMSREMEIRNRVENFGSGLFLTRDGEIFAKDTTLLEALQSITIGSYLMSISYLEPKDGFDLMPHQAAIVQGLGRTAALEALVRKSSVEDLCGHSRADVYSNLFFNHALSLGRDDHWFLEGVRRIGERIHEWAEKGPSVSLLSRVSGRLPSELASWNIRPVFEVPADLPEIDGRLDGSFEYLRKGSEPLEVTWSRYHGLLSAYDDHVSEPVLELHSQRAREFMNRFFHIDAPLRATPAEDEVYRVILEDPIPLHLTFPAKSELMNPDLWDPGLYEELREDIYLGGTDDALLSGPISLATTIAHALYQLSINHHPVPFDEHEAELEHIYRGFVASAWGIETMMRSADPVGDVSHHKRFMREFLKGAVNGVSDHYQEQGMNKRGIRRLRKDFIGLGRTLISRLDTARGRDYGNTILGSVPGTIPRSYKR